jgi:cell division protein FtsA
VALTTKHHLAVGIDAGASTTRCAICALEDMRLRFLGYGEAPSAGWTKGRLVDPAAASNSIRVAVQAAEKSAQTLIDGGVVGIGGPGIQGCQTRGVYEFGRPREVSSDEMAYAVERAKHVRLEDDRMLLHLLPQDFIIDGRAGYRNPRRATCTRLEVNVHAVTASRHDHDALIDAIHQAHLGVEESVYEPVAAAYAAIMQDDRARGVAVVDIGMNSTDLAVYDGDALLLAASIPVWGEHFTRDVAYMFKISLEDAEQLKREYGCAMLGLTADNSIIEVPSPENRGPREAKRRELNEVLEARAEELFHYVKTELHRVGMDQNLLEGVVLCGGGSLLNGMCDMAERVLNCQARNGLAIGVRNWPKDLDTPEYTTVAGLAMYSAKLKTRNLKKPKAPGIVNMVVK